MPDDVPADSILNSVKLQLGIAPDYTIFDPVIIEHINSVFSTLFQLKIGPTVATPSTDLNGITTMTYTESEFFIEDASTSWSEFLTGMMNMRQVKSYMYLRVRLLFDPPQTSFALDSIQKQIDEMTWRMNVQAESRV